MRIKQLKGNVFVEVAFDIAYLHPCNTSGIIFIDNCWCCESTNTTRLLYVVDHSMKFAGTPITSKRGRFRYAQDQAAHAHTITRVYAVKKRTLFFETSRYY